MEKKYHIIYKTTCTVNGNFYIGMHSTNNLNDSYLGSGNRLLNSIRKHGRENHVREILEFLSDRKALDTREREIVCEDLLVDPLCMNLTIGGEDHLDPAKLSEYGKKGVEYFKNNPEAAKERQKKATESLRRGFAEGRLKPKTGFLGRSHTEETKQKMRKPKNQGASNSQFGTVWITNGTENKKISSAMQIPDGWYRGRTLKI